MVFQFNEEIDDGIDIVLKMETSPELGHIFLSKFIQMLNFVFDALFHGSSYCEEYHNGVVMFTKDIPSFQLIWGRFSPEIKNIAKNLPISQNQLINPNLDQNNLDKIQFDLDLEFLRIPSPEDEVFEIIRTFWEDVSPEISLERSDRDFKIHFHDWAHFKHYLDLLNTQFTTTFPIDD